MQVQVHARLFYLNCHGTVYVIRWISHKSVRTKTKFDKIQCEHQTHTQTTQNTVNTTWKHVRTSKSREEECGECDGMVWKWKWMSIASLQAFLPILSSYNSRIWAVMGRHYDEKGVMYGKAREKMLWKSADKNYELEKMTWCVLIGKNLLHVSCEPGLMYRVNRVGLSVRDQKCLIPIGPRTYRGG